MKQHGKKFDELFKELKWEFKYGWEKVFETFKNMPVTDKFNLEWKDIDKEKIFKLLVDEHDFSEERINGGMERLMKERERKTQKGLGDFF